MKLLGAFLLGVIIGVFPVYYQMQDKVEVAEFGEMLANKTLNICMSVLKLKKAANELTK